MAQVVEAFRFLSARVRTLEERLAFEDRPVDGAAWLVPAPELGHWVDPVAGAHRRGHAGRRGGARRLRRGSAAGRAREGRASAPSGSNRGERWRCARWNGPRRSSITEVADELADRPPASLGGLVLSGVVDRLPLHALVSLLGRGPARPGAGCADRHRGERSRPGGPWTGTLAAGPRRRPGRCTPRPGSCSCERAGFVAVAPLDGAAGDGEAPRSPLVGRRTGVSGIHQFVPVLHGGDAVGRHTLRLRDAMRGPGHREPDLRRHGRDRDTGADVARCSTTRRRPAADDVLVYQFATASPMASWLAARRETLVVNYHNITPPELLAPWDNHLALGQLRAQAELGAAGARERRWRWPIRTTTEDHLVAAGFARDRGRPALGRPRVRRHRRRRPPAPRDRGQRRGALALRRPDRAQQGDRRHHRRAGGDPAARRSRGHAARSSASRPRRRTPTRCTATSPPWA